MRYDFDELIPRRGTNSVKWDEPKEEGVLPMWVADMDFRAAPAVRAALEKRVAHGIFGYAQIPQACRDAVVNWFSRRHRWSFGAEQIVFTTGVVPAVSAVIKAMCSPGDDVLLQTPAYNCFFSSVRNNECGFAESPLVSARGRYGIDFEDLEKKAAAPKTKLMLLCNPHNPVGRVWTREELLRIGEICLRHGVFVVSDEIHCELTFAGHDYTPFASLSPAFAKNSAVCVSPSKAFNLAGLQIAGIVAADADVRRRIDRAINVNEVCDVNPFGIEALIAAYGESEAWLDALRAYLKNNYDELCAFFGKNLPKFPVTPAEGTYLAWVDCRAAGMPSEELARRLEAEHKLKVSPGTLYGNAGEGFIRINVACPRERLRAGLEKLGNFLGKFS